MDQDIPAAACGGNGGSGGNGGNGGAAGTLTLNGNSGIQATNTPLESAGGAPGQGAAESSGIKVKRTFLGSR